MRKFIISATVAAIAAISFAAPSQAGGYGYNSGGYYGGGYYEPTCYIKKVKRWDRWGNVYFKRIRVCH